MKRLTKILPTIFLVLLFKCNKGPNDSQYTNPCDPKSSFFISRVEEFPFYIYQDFNSLQNHYFLDHVADPEPFKISINQASTDMPYRGTTCIEITWPMGNVTPTQIAHWYWLTSDNNVGDKNEGYNLSKAKWLKFAARGKLGGERVGFGMGGLWSSDKRYPDTATPLHPVPHLTFPLTLTQDWQEYKIEAELLTPTLCRVIAAFSFNIDRRFNPSEVTFYIDEIRYE